MTFCLLLWISIVTSSMLIVTNIPDGSCTETHTIFHDLFHFHHERLTME
jgi:hypothetical protein